MIFEKWLRTVCFQKPTPEAYDLAKCAWNAAIEAAAVAVESADHSDDDSGHGANCNAMMAVEKLKTSSINSTEE